MVFNNKVFITHLYVKQPPILGSSGRISTPAGEIAQIINGVAIRYIAYLEFINDTTLRRGNHYHRTKDEFLYIITGKLRVMCKDTETGLSEEIILGKGDLINIKPGCAHVYIPIEYTQAIEFSPDDFDVSDTHTYLAE